MLVLSAERGDASVELAGIGRSPRCAPPHRPRSRGRRRRPRDDRRAARRRAPRARSTTSRHTARRRRSTIGSRSVRSARVLGDAADTRARVVVQGRARPLGRGRGRARCAVRVGRRLARARCCRRRAFAIPIRRATVPHVMGRAAKRATLEALLRRRERLVFGGANVRASCSGGVHDARRDHARGRAGALILAGAAPDRGAARESARAQDDVARGLPRGVHAGRPGAPARAVAG